ncbi:MAG: helix-turn-helix transcriptional regulator [Candidatus Brockarchaeota archaeon]|nr:helix-turn-helix transcriptional regulator [Candidatus Brockarchaeota archaeon]
MCERSDQKEHVCLCPLEGIIDTIGKKWTLLVINTIGNRERLRFNQILEELKGISPTTLAQTLKELQKEKLVKRESFAQIPPKVEYSLTKDGVDLRRAIIPLLKWASARSCTSKPPCSPAYKKIPAHRIEKT